MVFDTRYDTFNYLGNNFIPCGTLYPYDREDTAKLMRKKVGGFGEMNMRKETGYSYNDFYKRADKCRRKADIFYCRRTHKYYIPAEAGLLEFTGAFRRFEGHCYQFDN